MLIDIYHWTRTNKLMWMIAIGLFFLVFRASENSSRVWANLGLVRLSALLKIAPEENLTLSAMQVESLLKQAVQNDPKNSSAWWGMGFVLLAQDRKDEAIIAWQNTTLSPALGFTIRGDYARSLGKNDEAVSRYVDAVDLEPNLARAWYAMGTVEQNRDHQEAALYAFHQAWKLGVIESANPLARSLQDQGNIEAATDIWQQALGKFHSHHHRLGWWHGLISSLRVGEQWDAALQLTQVAIAEFPDDPHLRIELGHTLYGLTQNPDLAIEAFQQAIDLDKNFPNAYAAIGRMKASQNLYGEAYNWYSEAVRLKPNEASWRLAQSNMARSSGNLELSLRLYQGMINQFPDFAPAYYEIAWTYRLKEQQEQAAEAIIRALNLSSSPELNYFTRAGAIYEWIGDSDKALDFYGAALTIDPDHRPAQLGLIRLQEN